MINLSVKRFQSLKNIDIDIDGLTILRGESGQGKSAVLRSLRASMTNRWTKGMIRDGEKSSEVIVDFNDGNMFKCTKTNTEIKYDVRYSNGEEKSYEKLRREIPEELGVVLGQTWIDDGDNKVSIQMRGQYDTPLIIGISHKRLAGVMGDGEEWNKCVTSEKKLRSWLTEMRGSDKMLAGMEEESSSRVDAMSREIESAKPVVEGVRSAYEEIKSLEDRLSVLRELCGVVESYKNTKEKEKSCEGMMSLLSDMLSCVELLSRNRSLSDVVDSIKSISYECGILSKICSVAGEAYSYIPSIDFNNKLAENIMSISSTDTEKPKMILSSISEYMSVYEKLSSNKELYTNISHFGALYEDKISYLVKYINSMQKGLTRKENAIMLKNNIGALQDVASMESDYKSRLSSDTCPLCGRKINEH